MRDAPQHRERLGLRGRVWVGAGALCVGVWLVVLVLIVRGAL